MAVVTMEQQSKDTRSFYAPQFQIKIENVGLPRNVLRDVVQLTYKDNINEIDSFEITVNNWDAERRAFKYVGAEQPQFLEKGNDASRADQLFDPCNKVVDVYMGYLDDKLTLMMKGNFTTLEPNFPAAGGPTLTVRGLNVLHQLRRTHYTHAWTDTTDSKIARNIASLKDKKTGRKRFPIPIEIDENAADKEPPLDFVTQQNQYDIDFLFQRARQRGYVVCVLEKERTLYFGPSTGDALGAHENIIELRYPGSLIEFKPTLTTANQVKSVTVRGWNRKTKQPINGVATLDDPKLNRNKDLYELLKKCDPREERVVNEPVFTEKQARARAIALLSERQKDMVKCTGSTVGLPDLRAGRKVHIKGVGPMFSGTYFITETTHTVGGNGYTTSFSARREDEGKKK